MKYTINPDIYYGRYGEYTYVRNVRDRMDYLYNEICYDVLEALSAEGGRTPQQLVGYLCTVCEAASGDQADFVDTLRSDMEQFLEELAGDRIVSAEEPEESRAAEPPDRIRDLIREVCYRERRLLTVCLELTYRCNEKCIHCYVDDWESGGGELSFSDYRTLLDDIRELGCMGVLLTGGEPTLHRDFFEIAFYAKRVGLMVDIYTNGLCVDDGMMDRLISLRPNSISFSFYGGKAEDHDAVTGVPGSFEKSLRTMMTCKCAGIDTFIKTVVIKQNVRGYEELLKLGKRLDIRVMSSLTVMPTHRGKPAGAYRLMDPEEYRRILELEYQYGLHGTEPMEGERGDYVCASGLDALSVNPWGEIYACNANPILLGTVGGDGIKSVWNTSEALRGIRELKFHQISGNCSGCADKNWCGICLGNALRENGSLKPCSDTCMISRASHEVYLNHVKGGETDEKV
mgnify:FL=1